MKHRLVAVLGLLQLAAGAFVSLVAVTALKVFNRLGNTPPAIIFPSKYVVLSTIVFVPIWMVLAIAAERTASAWRIYLVYAVGALVLISLIVWSILIVGLPFVVDCSLQGGGHR